MAKIGLGFYAGVPEWALPYARDGWQVWMDPNEHNPFGHENVIGRVPPGGNGDAWEYEFVRHGAEGGAAYGAYSERWWEKASQIKKWLGPNEPAANTREDARLLTEFYRGFAAYAHARGRQVLGGNFSRGRPDENILDAYVEMGALTDGLAFHEYGLRDMRDPADFGWHCFRYRRLMDVLRARGIAKDVYLTEWGLDLGQGDGNRDGWNGRVSAADYLAQLRWAAHEAAKDAYVKGIVMFHVSCYGFGSFGITPEIAQGIAEINRTLPTSAPIAMRTPAPTPAPVKTPTAFSQRDPRWKRKRLGVDGEKTLEEAGCLVSAVASALVDLGCGYRTPDALNDWLKAHGGFAQGNLYVWTAVKPLGAKLLKRVVCRFVPAPVGAIRQALAAGQAVIAQVDALPGGALDQHWVRILSVDADGKDALIMDPWQLPGHEVCRLKPRYTAAGWTVARALFAVAIYRK